MSKKLVSLSSFTQVTRESGPPHMKVFVTQCRVGDYTTEAQGNSKKLSKKKAAEKMLEQLRQLPSVTSTSQKAKPKMMATKKKNRNLIKVETLSTVSPTLFCSCYCFYKFLSFKKGF